MRRVVLSCFAVACHAVTTPPSTSSTTIGPSGGTITTPDGFELDIPPGALVEPTEIGVSVVQDGAPTGVSLDGPIFAITPNGLELAADAHVLLPLHSTLRIDDQIACDGSLPPSISVFLTPGSSSSFDLLFADPASTNQVRASLSKLGTIGPIHADVSLDALVGNESFGTCSTLAAVCLSRQIGAYTTRTTPLQLSRIPDEPNLSVGSDAFPYLQPPAAQSLATALEAHQNTKLVLNSALRTAAQQYIVTKWAPNTCHVAKAATPGTSNHEHGLGIDVQNFNLWTGTLGGSGGWTWLGATTDDNVHFTYTGPPAGVDDRRASLVAFQRLWDCNHPQDRICFEAGAGPSTEARLGEAPSNGFTRADDCPCHAGPYVHFVRTSVQIPTTTAEARMLGLDINGDGTVDNQLGQAFAAFATFGIDLVADNTTVGTVVESFAVQSPSLPTLATDSTCATWEAYRGADLLADLDQATEVQGSITGGQFVGVSDRATNPVRFAIFIGSDSVVLPLLNAHVEASLAGSNTGIIAGAVVQATVYPAITSALAKKLDLLVVADPGCPMNCAPGSEAATVSALFDVNVDHHISADEVANNGVIKSLLAPDVDVLDANGNPGKDGVPESLSVGFGFGFGPASFTAPCEH